VQPKPDAADVPTITVPSDLPRNERYIPVTRKALVRSFLEDSSLLTGSERDNFAEFAAALDAHIYQKFYQMLDEMKSLYDPLDPDKDTLKTKALSRQQTLDNEYWLLHKISILVNLANYTEIPAARLAVVFQEHEAAGLRISVDPQKYEVLKVWARGKKPIEGSLAQRVGRFIGFKKNDTYCYTRVMLAMRKKGETKLRLKIFKDVPCGQLEHLLPGERIRMSARDTMLIVGSAALVTVSGAAKLISTVSSVSASFSVAAMALFGFFGFQTWMRYSTKRNHYLANHSTFLFYKSVAHNRGVLTLLVDRAQDEEFKEMLLAYTFSVAAPNRRGIPGTVHSASPPLNHTQDTLQEAVERWLKDKFDIVVRYDHRAAIEALQDVGLLEQHQDGRLYASEMTQALKILPHPLLTWTGLAKVRDSQGEEDEDVESMKETI
jgi:hypothetical protein